MFLATFANSSLFCRSLRALRGGTVTGLFLLATFVPAQITQESEPNNTAPTATGPLSAGVFVSGTISGASDVDFFSYLIPGAGRVSVGVHGPAGATFSWILRDQNNNVVHQSNSGGRPELSSFVVPAASQGSLHTIEVRRESVTGPANSSSAYDLSIAYINNSSRPTKPGNITNYFAGASADSANQPIGGPAMMIMGGGNEVDNQFRDLVWPIVNRGNIVVLRTNPSNGYQNYFNSDIPTLFSPAQTPASVETLVIDTVAKANDAYTSWAVSRAELVWFAGGDQSIYINRWQGTALETAVHQAYARGAVIGGTSAGAMILGQYIYDPDGVSAVTSSQAINNPYHPSIHQRFTTNFFRFPIMRDILVETHTQFHGSNPNRLGRAATFMAYLRTEGIANRPLFVVGPDDGGGFFIPSSRIGTAQWTRFESWVLTEDQTTTIDRCVSGQPLRYNGIFYWRAERDRFNTLTQTFDFNNRAFVGGHHMRANVNDNVYTPTDWYYTTLPVSLSGFALD